MTYDVNECTMYNDNDMRMLEYDVILSFIIKSYRLCKSAIMLISQHYLNH